MKTRREVLEKQLMDAKYQVQWHKDRLQENEAIVDALYAALDAEDFAERKCSHV